MIELGCERLFYRYTKQIDLKTEHIRIKEAGLVIPYIYVNYVNKYSIHKAFDNALPGSSFMSHLHSPLRLSLWIAGREEETQKALGSIFSTYALQRVSQPRCVSNELWQKTDLVTAHELAVAVKSWLVTYIVRSAVYQTTSHWVFSITAQRAHVYETREGWRIASFFQLLIPNSFGYQLA